MPKVQLPDGTVAEFPDDMSHDQIASVIKGHLGGQQVAAPATDFRSMLAQALMPKQTGLTADMLKAGPLGGLVRGMRDPIDQGAALLTRGLQAVAPESLQPFAQRQVASVADTNR